MTTVYKCWKDLLSFITAVGTISALTEYWNSSWKYIILFAAFLSTGYLIWKSIRVTINILDPCNYSGITSIHSAKLNEKQQKIPRLLGKNQELADIKIAPHLKTGKNFRCLQVTAKDFLNKTQEKLKEFLSRENTDTTILICNPKSKFVADIVNIEKIAGKSSFGERGIEIQNEVDAVVGILHGIIDSVCNKAKVSCKNHGILTFGFCDTLFRNGIFTCDDFGWLTINMPPFRSNDCTISLELTRDRDESNLLEQANRHIDYIVKNIGEDKIIRFNPADTEFDFYEQIKQKYGMILTL